jgi:hypothetical protein
MLIDRVFHKEENRKVKQNDKGEYTLYPVSIKCGEDWYNGVVFSESDLTQMKMLEGTEVDIETYSEEYNGKTYQKFKTPKFPFNPMADILRRLDELEGKLGKSVSGNNAAVQTPVDSNSGDDDLPF